MAEPKAPVIRVPYPPTRVGARRKKSIVRFADWFETFKSTYLDEQPDEDPQLWKCGRCRSGLEPIGIRRAPRIRAHANAAQFGPLLVLRCCSCLRIEEMDLGPLIADGKAEAPPGV